MKKQRAQQENNLPENSCAPIPTVEPETKSHPLLLAILSLGAILLLFLADCLPEFTTDTYTTFTSTAWPGMLYSNGRIISALVYYIFEEYLYFPMPTVYMISYLTALIFFAAAVFCYASAVQEYFKHFLYAPMLSILLIANLFSIEYFLFIEKGLFALGIFLTVLAFRFTLIYLKTNSLRNVLIAEVLLILVVYIYQVFVGFFVILCLPFLLKYADRWKSFLRNNLLVAAMYGLSMGIGIITTRFILKSGRFETVDLRSAISNTLQDIAKTFFTSGRIAPAWFMTASLMAVLLLSCVSILIERKYVGFLQILYLLLGIPIISFLPYFLGTTTDIYAIRIKYPFAAIAATLLINLLLNYNCEEKLHQKAGMIALCSFFLFSILIECTGFISIFIDRYRCNQLDQYLSYLVLEEINRYETESGNLVSTICVYSDMSRSWSHPGLNYSLLNTRAFVQPWSDVSILNYYSHGSYIRGEPNADYAEYYNSQNWNLFSTDQLIFDGDTLHWCIY